MATLVVIHASDYAPGSLEQQTLDGLHAVKGTYTGRISDFTLAHANNRLGPFVVASQAHT